MRLFSNFLKIVSGAYNYFHQKYIVGNILVKTTFTGLYRLAEAGYG